MFEATTIIAVKKDGRVAIAGDGQVTMGERTIMKANARKVRKIFNDKILVGFAGSVADAFSLCERFEEKLQEYSGSLFRAAVELAQDWRGDKMLRKLEALLIAADSDNILVIAGSGEVIDADDGIAAIGSGGEYARAAAKALMANTELSAAEIVRKSLEIASEICVYTNGNITVYEL